MGLNILLVLAGLAGLYFGGEWLVTGSSKIALRFNVPAIIIGLTIVAVGTSAPELFVSVQAALDGKEGLALGNVIGSNIANIGLILGLSGTISVVAVKQTLIRREIPILIFITLFATVLILDGQLTRLDGILLLLGFIAFNFFFYAVSKLTDEELELDIPDEDELKDKNQSVWVDVAYVVAGSVLLVIGSRLMVIGATALAEAIGVSDLVIGVTIVAFGTSLPELATSITAIMKQEDDIAIGNVIGSNVANLLLVLGATSTIKTINVGDTDLSIVEYVVMVGFTLILLPFARDKQLSRVESAILLGAYMAFILYSFFSPT
ncbi:MAG: calcium/sodium antiporter [Phototrophicaceae bacterium]